mgnify:CR=1 FL=1
MIRTLEADSNQFLSKRQLMGFSICAGVRKATINRTVSEIAPGTQKIVGLTPLGLQKNESHLFLESLKNIHSKHCDLDPSSTG